MTDENEGRSVAPKSHEQDLIDRVAAKANKDRVKALLAEYKQQFPDEINVSGNSADLADHLRKACDLGRIPRPRVFELLQDCEENGKQSILYYAPNSAAVRAACSNPEVIAATLFGTEWRSTQGFPKLPQLQSGYEIADFRIGLPGKPADWLLKLYTFAVTEKVVREYRAGDVAEPGLTLAEDEHAVVYKRQVSESVCCARWNSHPTCPLLELRFEQSSRRDRIEVDANAIWSRLQDVFARDVDFLTWDLGPSLQRILSDCPLHEDLYEIALAHLVDSGDAGVQYTTYTEHDTLAKRPVRLQIAMSVLDDGGRCTKLVTTWLPAKSDGRIAVPLRTAAGPRQSNELVITAQTTAQAVDYVTDQLRHFAG